MSQKPKEITSLNGWMTVPQAGRYKGVTAKAIHKKIDRGTLPYGKFGNTILVRKTDLDLWEPNLKMQQAQRSVWAARKRRAERARAAASPDAASEAGDDPAAQNEI